VCCFYYIAACARLQSIVIEIMILLKSYERNYGTETTRTQLACVVEGKELCSHDTKCKNTYLFFECPTTFLILTRSPKSTPNIIPSQILHAIHVKEVLGYCSIFSRSSGIFLDGSLKHVIRDFFYSACSEERLYIAST